MNEKKSLFPEALFKGMKEYLVDHKIEFNVKENKDQTVAFNIYEEAISKYPEDAAFFTQELAGAYSYNFV